ncbi:MAG: hypothetical protein HYS55_06155 [Candidatus Omnitrophica bacterium]|nr:hypothetical protein [Candidatus Omnitrophota bacterium]
MNLLKIAKAASMLYLCLTMVLLCTPKMLVAEDAIAAPPSEASSVSSVINLEGFSPADNITIENGLVKIETSNVSESVSQTLVEQGVITNSSESANAPDARLATVEQPFQLNEVVNDVFRNDIPSPRIDPILRSDKPSFQASPPIQNSGPPSGSGGAGLLFPHIPRRGR